MAGKAMMPLKNGDRVIAYMPFGDPTRGMPVGALEGVVVRCEGGAEGAAVGQWVGVSVDDARVNPMFRDGEPNSAIEYMVWPAATWPIFREIETFRVNAANLKRDVSLLKSALDAAVQKAVEAVVAQTREKGQ